VCESAAEALVELGDARAVEPLIAIVTQGPQLRADQLAGRAGRGSMPRIAVDALGRLGDERAVEPLVEAVNRDQFDYATTPLRVAGVEALGQLTDPGADDALIASLKELEYDTVPEVRKAALRVLGRRKDASLTPFFADRLILETDAEARDAAANALAAIGDPAIDALVFQLQSDRPYLRRRAIAALKEIGGERSEKALADVREALEDQRLRHRVRGEDGNLGV